eukprot:RCo034786
MQLQGELQELRQQRDEALVERQAFEEAQVLFQQQASAVLEQRCAVAAVEVEECQGRVEACLVNLGEYVAGLLAAQEQWLQVRSSASTEELRRELVAAEEGRKKLEAGLQEGEQEYSERLQAAQSRAEEAEAQLQQKSHVVEELTAKLQETREKAKQALQSVQEKKKQSEARVAEMEICVKESNAQLLKLQSQLNEAEASAISAAKTKEDASSTEAPAQGEVISVLSEVLRKLLSEGQTLSSRDSQP